MKKEKPNLNSRAGKYVTARVKGKNKKEAALEAGYSLKSARNATSVIENTKEVQKLKEYYREKLLGKITLEDLADEHIKIILQDDDKSAKLRAIELGLDKIEPDSIPQEEDRILVILK